MKYSLTNLIHLLCICLIIGGCAAAKSEILRNQGFNIANLNSVDNSTDKAIEYLLESLKLEPNNARALRTVGRLYFLKNEYDKAEYYLKQAVALESRNGINWNILGWVYGRTERYTEMRDAFEKAIEYDKNSAWNHYGLGRAYYYLRLYDKAKQFVTIGMSKSADSSIQNAGIAYLNYIACIEGDYETAKRLFKQRPAIGLRISEVNEEPGVKITQIYEGTLAHLAGLKVNDIIVEVNGKVVNSNDAIIQQIVSSNYTDSMNILIKREGQASTRPFNLVLDYDHYTSIQQPAKAVTELPQPSKQIEKRLALVIGNGAYPNASLMNPVNDARAMSKALRRLNFDVIFYENIERRGLNQAIDSFGDQLKTYNVGLFFYAGHGVQVNGQNYIIPIDAEPRSANDVEYDCVNVGRILGKMEDARTKTNIIILDACRNNPFEQSWTRSAQGRGLAVLFAPSGSLIAYATSPGKVAYDQSNVANSPYTSAILKHIENPDLTIIEMFQRVRASVLDETNRFQTPWESTSLTGNFYFKHQ